MSSDLPVQTTDEIRRLLARMLNLAKRVGEIKDRGNSFDESTERFIDNVLLTLSWVMPVKAEAEKGFLRMIELVETQVEVFESDTDFFLDPPPESFEQAFEIYNNLCEVSKPHRLSELELSNLIDQHDLKFGRDAVEWMGFWVEIITES